MLTWTDVIVITILVVLAANGSYQGLLRSLIGPFCFIVASAVGYAVYLFSRSIALALLIALLGPFLLTWIGNSILRAKLGDYAAEGFISRVLGAIFNTLWGGSILLTILLLLTIAPLKRVGLDGLRKDMNASSTYRFLEKIVVGRIDLKPKPSGPECPTGLCSMTKTDVDALSEDKELQSIADDPRVQKLVNDPELREAIEKQNIGKLMTNPAILQLSADPAFLAKVLKAYPKIKARMNGDL